MMNVFCRKIMGHDVYLYETGKLASGIVRKICWQEYLSGQERPLMLHSDNGSP